MAEQDQYDAPLPPLSVGARLCAAREAAGLSRADVAARTKIAERHLGAIEEDRFDDLASSTYAVGFARAYARTVGLDEAEIARLVRGRLEALVARPVMYELVEHGEEIEIDGRTMFAVRSKGQVYPIMAAEKLRQLSA